MSARAAVAVTRGRGRRALLPGSLFLTVAAFLATGCGHATESPVKAPPAAPAPRTPVVFTDITSAAGIVWGSGRGKRSSPLSTIRLASGESLARRSATDL